MDIKKVMGAKYKMYINNKPYYHHIYVYMIIFGFILSFLSWSLHDMSHPE